jgi:hypothetical protein
VLIIGRPDRFQCGKQIASYLGLVMWRKRWDYEQLKSSVRTRDNPEIAMVCSRTPSN